MNTISERLSWARAQAGFKSATDAARHYGWNENTYRSHENGAREPKREVAQQYAKAFKVSFDWLFLGTGQAKTDNKELDALINKYKQADDNVRKAVNLMLGIEE